MGKKAKKKKREDGLPETPFDDLVKESRKIIKQYQKTLGIRYALKDMLTDENEIRENEAEIERIERELQKAIRLHERNLNDRMRFIERLLY